MGAQVIDREFNERPHVQQASARAANRSDAREGCSRGSLKCCPACHEIARVGGEVVVLDPHSAAIDQGLHAKLFGLFRWPHGEVLSEMQRGVRLLADPEQQHACCEVVAMTERRVPTKTRPRKVSANDLLRSRPNGGEARGGMVRSTSPRMRADILRHGSAPQARRCRRVKGQHRFANLIQPIGWDWRPHPTQRIELLRRVCWDYERCLTAK